MKPFDLRKWPGFIAAGGDPSNSAIINRAAIDSRRIESPNSLFIALKGRRLDGHQFTAQSGAKYALVKKGYQQKQSQPILLRVDDPLRAFQEIVSCYRQQLRGNVVCIAGSYGKTMVKDLLHHLLESSFHIASSPESFNSQIGVPLSLLHADDDHEHILIEAGFSRIGEAEKLEKMIAPSFTVITSVGQKHLHDLGSQKQIACEIEKLYPRASKNWILSPIDSFLTPHPTTYYWESPSSQLPHVTLSKGDKDYLIQFPNQISGSITRPIGMSYLIKILNISIKAAYLLGASPEQILEQLKTYQPEPMRTEIWRTSAGTMIINDSYCADPQSLDVSLNLFHYTRPKGRKILLFSGIRKTSPSTFSRLGEAIGRAKPQTILLTEAAPQIEKTIRQESPESKILHFPTVDEALNMLQKNLRPEDVLIIKGKHKLPLEKLTKTMHGSVFTNQCCINLAAIASNIKLIRSKLSKNTELMAMVKAMAYGTDQSIIAKFLKTEGIDRLGVSYVDEAIALRREGVDQKIFVLNAAPFESEKVVDWGFEVAVNDRLSLINIENAAKKRQKRASVHLHVDTGMSRLGCRPEEALPLAHLINQSPFLDLEGVMTHFACSNDPGQDSFTLKQSLIFDETIAVIENAGIKIPFKHACNSQAALRLHFPQYNMARIGIALYGLCPEGTLALSLTSCIVGINHCRKGETISYGRSYTVAKEEERIAVIPIGYYDGLHLNYSGKGKVKIHGKTAPIVGQICMDYMMVDITHIPEAATGDSVLIFGRDAEEHSLSPQTLADQGNSTVYELLTCLGPRIQRVFIHEEDEKIK